jgi:peptidoglycan/LPS O-acetylase OafA/YrhL
MTAPETKSPARPRLLSLTSLRAFAAFAVFTRHASETFFTAGDHSSLTRQGATGVSFFFILSGFVLAWSYRPGDQAGRFFRRRFARIYPAYILMLVVTQVAVGARHGFPLVPFVLNATLVQSWVPGAKVFFTSDMGAWSLGCEAFFYLLFPLLLPLIGRATPRRRWQLLGLVLVADLAVALATHSSNQSAGIGLWLVYILPLTRLGEFLVGMVLATAVAEGLRSRISLNQALVLALVAYGVAGLVPVYLMWEVLTLVPFSLLVLSAASWEAEGRSTWMGRHWLVRFGEWSYAFYLVHISVLAVIHHLLPHQGGAEGLGLTALSLVLAVAAAFCLFHLVERPLERRLRGDAGTGEAAARLSPLRVLMRHAR